MKTKKKVGSVSERIRLLIVEDHPVVREGISALLARRSGIEVVGEASNGDDGLGKIKDLRPDVVLMDADLPGKDGLTVAEAARRDCPEVRVIIFSAYKGAALLRRAAEAGVCCFLSKDASLEGIALAVEKVAGGWTDPALRQGGGVDSEAGVRGLDRLTNREKDVLLHLANGLRNKEIAQRLCIETKTVGVHREALMRKLRRRSVADLTRFAVAAGLVRASGLGDWVM